MLSSRSLIILNLENASNQLVTYLCNNTTELKQALDEANNDYKPFPSYLSYLNPANYPRWLKRSHVLDFEKLEKNLNKK